mmetsp:Transcript_9306/g.28747  ORF Transcript_9306/g.28747 Transcript_9306/m.28747 type:complete len:188 (+) Transcript_9306:859-1422(+)
MDVCTPVEGVGAGGGDVEYQDGPERQACRAAALELFCRCLATVPRPDAVLNLRGAPTVQDEVVDTVLQRVVLLCHHELLCLGIHGDDGGPWRDAALRECAARRSRSVDLSLSILSSFVWQTAPWAPDVPQVEADATQAETCAALGRMRPLLASIVDMASRRGAASGPGGSRALAAASALRVLLAKAD